MKSKEEMIEDFNNIPIELKAISHWVGFKVDDTGKIPVSPGILNDGANAKIDDSTTWGTYAEAVALVKVGMCQALGFAITKDTGYIFVDLDCHVDSTDSEQKRKEIEMKYRSFCTQAKFYETYMETSVSGNGVHLLAKGELLPDYCTGKSPISPVELYDDKRFMIITGDRLNDEPISDGEKTLSCINKLQMHNFLTKSEVEKSRNIQTGIYLTIAEDTSSIEKEVYSDEEVLEVAMCSKNFKLLWDGKWDEVKDKNGHPKYTHQHFSDYALVCSLIFYTHNCVVQAERLFRQSPCYQAYGKNGKCVKYEKDIETDLRSASEKCMAVYIPKSEIIDLDSSWKPDFKAIKALIDNEAISNPVLKSRLKVYIQKYKGSENEIRYIPYLFACDQNVNGYTQIVHRVLGDQLIYSNKMNSFFKWSGKKYDMVNEDVLYHAITEVLAMVEHSVFMWVATEVMGADDDEPIQEGTGKNGADVTEKEILEQRAVDHFNQCIKIVSIKNCSDIFKKLKGMYVTTDLVDYLESPYINMQNGILNIETKELLPHSPDYRLHKITSCDYDPNATCPTFDTMLETIFPDADTRKEMLKAFGLCLIKEKEFPAKKVLILMIGKKDSGKTTLINSVNFVLGDYGTSIDNSLLMRSYKDKSNVGPELLALRDTLLISTSEISGEASEARLDASKVKAMTGNSIISTRNLYDKQMIQFSVIGLIFIDTNYKAVINDNALWERLRVYPFTHIFTKKDPTLRKKLDGEKAGIFNRLLEGLSMVIQDGELFECPTMQEAKTQYKTEMTVMEQFLSDCTSKTDSSMDRIPTTKLFETYQNWCDDNGFHTIIRNKFYSEVSEHLQKKKSGIEYFVNCNLTDIGNLYSHMKEKSKQQFAKDKARIISGVEGQPDYSVLRKVYFARSQKWFVENISSADNRAAIFDRYGNYAEWCIKQGIMPIIPVDFNRVAMHLFDNLTTNRPSQDLIDSTAKMSWE